MVRNFSRLGALAAVCDASDSTLGRQRDLYPGVATTSRYADLLEDGNIRAIVIATPAGSHYEQAKQALMAGKDVFVEKPLALSYQQGCELVKLAQQSGAILMVGHVLEYHPAIAALKELVRRGELGDLLYVYSNRLNLGRVRQEENILWSFAPHDISVACSLVGDEPTSVSACGGSYLQTGIVDVTVTNLSFPRNVSGHIFVSWLHPYKEQRLVVIGDRKMASFDDTAPDHKLTLYDKGIEWRSGLPVPRNVAEMHVPFSDREPLEIECSHFLECIANREEPLTGGSNALAVLRVLEACQRSLESQGTPVDLQELETAV